MLWTSVQCLDLNFQVGAPQFRNGTTNGAAWYPLTGGMQDYNYIWHGAMEVTLELSCCKFPPSTELPQFWDDNRNSLLQFMGEAHRGVKGFVKDETLKPIEGASMKVTYVVYKRDFHWNLMLRKLATCCAIYFCVNTASWRFGEDYEKTFIFDTLFSCSTHTCLSTY